jgi:type I restriction enzyme S subunit
LNPPPSIPWPVDSIGNCTLPTLQRDPRKDGGTFRYVDIASINRETKQIEDAKELPCEDAPSRARKSIRANDILVSTVRPNLNAVAQVPPELDGQIASTGFAVLRPDPKIVHPRYIFYRVITNAFINDMIAQSKGAGYPAVSDRIVAEHKLPLPPLPEQHRIVEILDQADTLRQQRRQADALAQRILPALFQEMFGDLRRNQNDWEVSDLGELTEIVSGITKGRRTSATSLKEVAYLSVANVQDAHLRMENVKVIEASEDEIKRYRLRPDDLVLTEGGDPDKLGRGALWKGEINECIHQNHVFRVRISSPSLRPVFLSALTASEYGKSYFLSVAKKTTGIASINKRQLSAFPVVMPPLEIQLSFENALVALNKSIDDQTTSTTTLETLFQTLLHRAFDGSLTAKWREEKERELLQK